MELIKEDLNKKIFKDGDNKIYSMLNMGSYVGHRKREWYASAPEAWRLMFFDEKREDGKECHIEALVDDNGNYMRFLIDLGNVRRAIQLHNELVFNDVIIENGDSLDGAIGDTYVAIDGDIYFGPKVLLEEYLSTTPEFSSGDTVFKGEIPGNDLIAEFLNKNEELKKMLEPNKKL